MKFKKAVLKKYLECAKVINTHGVKGTLKLECYTDTPQSLARLKTLYMLCDGEYVPFKVERASVQKNMVLVQLEGIDTVEKAIAQKNKVLYADRDAFRLRRGDFFIADILGLPVVDFESKEEYGILKEVLSPAGQQVYVVEKKDGRTFMIPCVPEFIKNVSLGEDSDAGIYVALIEGMDE